MGKLTALAAVAIALLLLPIGQAEERPTAAHPHGLPFENPLALTPAAYDFFHPSARVRRAPGVAAAPALAPRGQQLRESAVRGTTASVARADQEEGGMAPARTARHHKFAAVFVGAAAAALVAIGVAYAVVRRRVAAARGRGGGGGGADAGAPKSNA